MDLSPPENEVKEMQLLLHADEYEHDGVIMEMVEPMDPNHFNVLLRNSIPIWTMKGKKAVWIKLPIKLVNLLEIAVEEGFMYHHAERHYLMLVYCIIPDALPSIPRYATHRVRIGAIVMNNRNELLVVLEKHGRSKGKGFWKIPTGILDEGEDIFTCARREVKEETGIETEFEGVPALSQEHKSFFKKSDLFVLCILRPLSFDIQVQESEIEAAQWMPISEYTAQPLAKEYSIFKYVSDICVANVEKSYSTGLTPMPMPMPCFSDKICYLYANQKDLQL